MTQKVAEGGFRFIPGVYQYSAGVAAEAGFRLERVRFAEPIPLMAGFARIAAYLDAIGRPNGMGLVSGWAEPDCAQQCLPGNRPTGRALLSRLYLYGAGCERCAFLRRGGQW
jgi:hypothetical protein